MRVTRITRPSRCGEVLGPPLGGEVVRLLEGGHVDLGVPIEVRIQKGGCRFWRSDDEKIRQLHRSRNLARAVDYGNGRDDHKSRAGRKRFKEAGPWSTRAGPRVLRAREP